MKKLTKILMLALVFVACEDEIQLDVPDGSTKLVVDGTISSLDSLQRIRLTTTSSYFDANPTPSLSGADVLVTTDKGISIPFTEVGTSGNYEAIYDITDTSLIYTLHITTPDGQQYQSYEEILNRVPPIDSLVQSDKKTKPQGPNDEEEGYVAMLNTYEPKGLGDYYRWIIFINGKQSTDPFDLMITDDRMVDGNYILDWDIVYGLQADTVLTVHQMAISKRAYNYWSLVFAQITKFGGPFDTPPAPIEGNIFNVNNPDEKVLGFFGVNNVESATIIIVEK